MWVKICQTLSPDLSLLLNVLVTFRLTFSIFWNRNSPITATFILGCIPVQQSSIFSPLRCDWLIDSNDLRNWMTVSEPREIDQNSLVALRHNICLHFCRLGKKQRSFWSLLYFISCLIRRLWRSTVVLYFCAGKLVRKWKFMERFDVSLVRYVFFGLNFVFADPLQCYSVGSFYRYGSYHYAA